MLIYLSIYWSIYLSNCQEAEALLFKDKNYTIPIVFGLFMFIYLYQYIYLYISVDSYLAI